MYAVFGQSRPFRNSTLFILRIILALTAYLLPHCSFTFRWSECSRLVVCRWGQDAGSDYFSSCSIACSRWLKQKCLAELMEEESSLMGTPRFCYCSNHWKGVSNVEVFQQWWLWSLIYHLKWTAVKFFLEDLFVGVDSFFGRTDLWPISDQFLFYLWSLSDYWIGPI